MGIYTFRTGHYIGKTLFYINSEFRNLGLHAVKADNLPFGRFSLTPPGFLATALYPSLRRTCSADVANEANAFVMTPSLLAAVLPASLPRCPLSISLPCQPGPAMPSKSSRCCSLRRTMQSWLSREDDGGWRAGSRCRTSPRSSSKRSPMDSSTIMWSSASHSSIVAWIEALFTLLMAVFRAWSKIYIWTQISLDTSFFFSANGFIDYIPPTPSLKVQLKIYLTKGQWILICHKKI